MHACVYVIGDRPVERAKLVAPDVDWAGIGGRYTGSLPATTGIVHGDTVPDFEASLMKLVAEADPDGEGGMQRMGARQDRGGYDQAYRRDLDLTAAVPSPAFIVDLDDEVYTNDWTPEEEGTAMALKFAETSGLPLLEEHISEDIVRSLYAKQDHWDAFVAQVLHQLDGDALVTVVDIHQ